MASDLNFVLYVCDQIKNAGEISYKKMFGEYAVYCNNKVVALVCNNQFFVKKTEAGTSVCPNCEEAAPYDGSKPYLVIDCVDDSEVMTMLIAETCRELPEPKPKKKKNA